MTDNYFLSSMNGDRHDLFTDTLFSLCEKIDFIQISNQILSNYWTNSISLLWGQLKLSGNFLHNKGDCFLFFGIFLLILYLYLFSRTPTFFSTLHEQHYRFNWKPQLRANQSRTRKYIQNLTRILCFMSFNYQTAINYLWFHGAWIKKDPQRPNSCPAT